MGGENNKSKKREIHIVTHHNMFGASCETGSENLVDFEIYCYAENDVCIPTKCENCEYFAGSEMGKGITCSWFDTDGNLSFDEHVVQHKERYSEKDRVARLSDTDKISEKRNMCI